MTIKTILFRAVPALIFIVLFVVFLIPLRVRILNLGNAAGAVFSAAAAAVFIFWKQFAVLLGRLWQSAGGKFLLTAAGLLIALSVISAAAISVLMIREMNDSPDGRETTLVVLGCKVQNGAPSVMLMRRINAAYAYLSEHEDVQAVVSGGQGDDESISEAQCMRDSLVAMGVSSDRIYMEDRSENTEENLRFSREIIESEGLCGHITIVTDGFHQMRAEMLARQQGLEAYNIAARTPAWLVPTYWVREWFGVAYYAVFGRKGS